MNAKRAHRESFTAEQTERLDRLFAGKQQQAAGLRPGEQPLPTTGGQEVSRVAQSYIRDMIGVSIPYPEPAEDICTELERRVIEHGIPHYGTRLQTNNGRVMIDDCDEEILDAINFQQGDVLEHPDDGFSRLILWKIIGIALDIRELKARRKANEAPTSN